MRSGHVVDLQTWLIKFSLGSTGIAFLFLVLSPAAGFPLEYAQAFHIMQIVLPVFVGYLGSAATFLFRRHSSTPHLPAISDQVILLIRGPVYVFVAGLAGSFFAFGYTNRLSAPPGTGMSLDALTTCITVLLGLLSVTTGSAVSYLFHPAAEPARAKQ